MARNPAAAEPSNEKLRNDAFVLMFDDEGFVVRNQTLQAEGIRHERDFVTAGSPLCVWTPTGTDPSAAMNP